MAGKLLAKTKPRFGSGEVWRSFPPPFSLVQWFAERLAETMPY